MRQFEEFESRGYGDSEKKVCHECTSDYALKNHIKENGKRHICDYCGKDRKCIPLEDLMEPIMNGILHEYEDAVGCLGWDSAEGGYLGTTYDNHDLIHNELYDELGIEDKALLDDIANIMNDIAWCDRNPYGESEDKEAYYSWSSFSKLVKEKTRYVFYKISQENDDRSFSSPAEILDTIGGYVGLLNLTITLNPQKCRIYRGRTHTKENEHTKVEDFVSPPSEKAKANRMSPEGISMFYGAYEKDTVLSEIYCTTDEFATIAEFQLLRPLKVLDLSKPMWLKMPSLFDEDRRNRRAPLLFLRRFATEISHKTVNGNNIDYVPTQIVTEYFRHVFKTKDGSALDGIVYRSAQNDRGKCIVLFFDRDDCVENDINNKGILLMKRITKYKKEYLTVDG